MIILVHKYSSNFFLSFLFLLIVPSCIKKHQMASSDKIISENKMISVLTEIFKMEAYVNDKLIGSNIDSLTFVKKSLYAPILSHYKVDSTDFYTTFNYYQSNPNEFIALLSLVDSNLVKIKPLDTTETKQLVAPPENIEQLGTYNEQEAAMRDVFIKKNHQKLNKLHQKKPENQQKQIK